MRRVYIFEKKGIYTENYLSPQEIQKYEKSYGKLLGVEYEGQIIEEKSDGFNKQRNSSEI